MGNTVARSPTLDETWEYLCTNWDQNAVYSKLSVEESADIVRDVRIFIDSELGAAKMADRLWYSYENLSPTKFVNRLEEQCSLILELIYQLRLAMLEVKLKAIGGKGLIEEFYQTSLLDGELDAPDKSLFLTTLGNSSAPEVERVKALRSLALSEISSIYHTFRVDMTTVFASISNSLKLPPTSASERVEHHPQQTYFDQSIRTHLIRLAVLENASTSVTRSIFFSHYLIMVTQTCFELLYIIRPGAPRPYPSIIEPFQPLELVNTSSSGYRSLTSEDRALVHSFVTGSAGTRTRADPLTNLPLLSAQPPFLHSVYEVESAYCYNLRVKLNDVIPEALVRLDHRITPMILSLSTSILRVAHTQYTRLKTERARDAASDAINDINNGPKQKHLYPANLFLMVSACITSAGYRREWWSVTEPKPLGTDCIFDVPLLTKFLPQASQLAARKEQQHVLNSDASVITHVDALSLFNSTHKDATTHTGDTITTSKNIYTDNLTSSRVAGHEDSVSVCSPAIRLAVHVVRLTTVSNARQRALPHNQHAPPLTPLVLAEDGTLKTKGLYPNIAMDELDDYQDQELCMELVGTIGGLDDVYLSSIMNFNTALTTNHIVSEFAPMKVPLPQLSTCFDATSLNSSSSVVSSSGAAPTAIRHSCVVTLTPVAVSIDASDIDLGVHQVDPNLFTASLHVGHVAGLCAAVRGPAVPYPVLSLHKSLALITQVLSEVAGDTMLSSVRSILSGTSCSASVSSDWEGVCWASFMVHSSKALLNSVQKRLAVYELLSPGCLNEKHVSPHTLKAVNKLNKELKTYLSYVEEDINDYGKMATTLVLGSRHTEALIDSEGELVYNIREWGKRKANLFQQRQYAVEDGQDPDEVLDFSAPTPFDAAEDVIYSMVPHPNPEKLYYFHSLPEKVVKEPFKPFRRYTDSQGRLPVLTYEEKTDITCILEASTTTETPDKLDTILNNFSFGLFSGKEEEKKEESKTEDVSERLDLIFKVEPTSHPGLSYWPVRPKVPSNIRKLFEEKPIPEMPPPPEPVPDLTSEEVEDLNRWQRSNREEKIKLIEAYPLLWELWKREMDQEESVVPTHMVRGLSMKNGKLSLSRDTEDDVFFDEEDLVKNPTAGKSKGRRRLPKSVVDQKKHNKVIASLFGDGVSVKEAEEKKSDGLVVMINNDLEDDWYVDHHKKVIKALCAEETSHLVLSPRTTKPFQPRPLTTNPSLAMTYPSADFSPAARKPKPKAKGKGRSRKNKKKAAAAAAAAQESIGNSFFGLFSAPPSAASSPVTTAPAPVLSPKTSVPPVPSPRAPAPISVAPPAAQRLAAASDAAKRKISQLVVDDADERTIDVTVPVRAPRSATPAHALKSRKAVVPTPNRNSMKESPVGQTPSKFGVLSVNHDDESVINPSHDNIYARVEKENSPEDDDNDDYGYSYAEDDVATDDIYINDALDFDNMLDDAPDDNDDSVSSIGILDNLEDHPNDDDISAGYYDDEDEDNEDAGPI